MMMSNWPTSVWNELLVLSLRRHQRWKHSATILLESHLTQHIKQIPCFVGQGLFPRSTRLVWSVWHRMATLHRLEKLTAKRLFESGLQLLLRLFVGYPIGAQGTPIILSDDKALV